MSQTTAAAWIVGVVLMSSGAGAYGQAARQDTAETVVQGCLALAPPSQPSSPQSSGNVTPQTFLLERTSAPEQTRDRSKQPRDQSEQSAGQQQTPTGQQTQAGQEPLTPVLADRDDAASEWAPNTSYRLVASPPGPDLKMHLGHRVEVRGRISAEHVASETTRQPEHAQQGRDSGRATPGATAVGGHANTPTLHNTSPADSRDFKGTLAVTAVRRLQEPCTHTP